MQPDGNTRKLGFPLTFSDDVESLTPNDPEITYVTLENWNTGDPDERVNITLNLSLNEYVALATCVDIGRDIAYGDNSIYIWWIWVRSLVAVDDCASVANCIETDPATQTALNTFLQSNVGFDSPSNNPDSQNMELINPTDCDLDEIWGNAVALWNAINQTTIDMLEVIAQATNISELASDIISAIPILGQLPVDEIIGLIAQMGDWLLENYNAALTITLEQQIQCDLFCLMKDGCGITFKQLIDYFTGYFLLDINAYQLIQMIGWLTGVVPAGEAFVKALAVFQLFVVGIAEQFFGIPTTSFYATQAQLGEPDDDWMTLCDECPDEWSHTFDLTSTSGHPFTILEGTQQTDYVQSILNTGLNLQSQQIVVDFGESINITQISVDSWISNFRPPTTPEGAFLYGTTYPYTGLLATYDMTALNTIQTHTWTGNISTFGLRLRLVSATSGSNRQYQVTIAGTGTDPFA